MRDYATFRTDLPDDTVEENGDIVRPGGANVVEHLRSALATRGLAPARVDQHSFYGWAFEVPVDGVAIWCLLQFVDPWLLITEVRSRWLHRLFGRRPDDKHSVLLTALSEILAAPPFSECKWTSRAEYETPDPSP